MFGFLYVLGLTIGSVVSGTKSYISNVKAKQRGINRYFNGINLSETYIDRNGIRRDLNTNKIASINNDIDDICDDEYLWLDAPKIKVRNLSKEKRDIEFIEGRRGNWFGRTVDLYDSRNWTMRGNNKNKINILGSYYKDLNNNEIYVCRELQLVFDNEQKKYILYDGRNKYFNNEYIYRKCKFYMNIKNGLLIRKSDTQLESEKKYKSENDLTDIETYNFIRDFNKMQKSGGWYYSNRKRCIDYFCNDMVADDHIYKLTKLQENN